jgi:hypothetical protein
MGSRRRSTAGANSGDYAALRRLTAAQAPDLTVFRAVLERVGGTRARMRFAEGVVYAQACQRYRELSGEDYGPRIGTY